MTCVTLCVEQWQRRAVHTFILRVLCFMKMLIEYTDFIGRKHNTAFVGKQELLFTHPLHCVVFHRFCI